MGSSQSILAWKMASCVTKKLLRLSAFRSTFANYISKNTISTHPAICSSYCCAKKSLLLSHIQNAPLQIPPLRLYSDKEPMNKKYVEDRVLLVLRLYDKINADKLSLESHLMNDMGLDSLDHVEVIMAMEDEFWFEIPDLEAEKLIHPKDIVQYVCDRQEIYD